MYTIPTLPHIYTKTVVILWCGQFFLAHLNLSGLLTSRRGMHWVVIIVHSLEHNFSFKAHFGNHFIHTCVWVLGYSLLSSKGRDRGRWKCKAIANAGMLTWTDIKCCLYWSLVAPISHTRCLPPNGDGSAPPPLWCLWETLEPSSYYHF